MKISRILPLGLATLALLAAPALAQDVGKKKSGDDPLPRPTPQKTERQKIIEKYDENGDGVLTGAELRKAQPELDALKKKRRGGDGDKKKRGGGDGDKKKRGDGEGRKKRGDGDGPKPKPGPKPGPRPGGGDKKGGDKKGGDKKGGDPVTA